MNGVSRFRRSKKRITLAAIRYFSMLMTAVVFLSNRVFAQSCALCYTSVAGGGPGVARALRGGILVLLVPPVMLFTALIVVVVRWRTIHGAQ
jgi:hypothetical protein